MEYTIKKRPDLQTIIVEASGVINTDAAKSMAIEAGHAAKHFGFKKCYFDLRKTELDPRQTMSGMFMFVEVFKSTGIDKYEKIAAVVVEVEEQRKQLEKSAIFDGINFKYFTDKEEAMDWLNS